MRRLSRDSVGYHFPLLIGKFIRGCLCMSVALSSTTSCSVFGRVAMMHEHTHTHADTRRESTHIYHRAPRDHSIRYDRSRLSLLAAVSNAYCERGIDEWTADAAWFSTSN